MKQFLKGTSVSVELVKENPINLIQTKINASGREDKDDAFFIADLGDVVRKFKLWHSQLPRIEPFYAVKCNEDPGLLSVLAQLGTGFDCASKGEIQKILEMKVSPDRIIYANPCKQSSHVRYAAKHNVPLMTFDNMPELHKIKINFPDAKLVVRIQPPDDTKCVCPLGMKYGCDIKQVPHLLKAAKDMGLNVVGVSFHVGSGCYDTSAFPAAVASARTVFDMGEKAGFHFELLDVGGGFPGQKTAQVSFEEIAMPLRVAVDMYFPESMGVRIIAEPGRFFSASAYTLCVNIIAKRVVARDEPNYGPEDFSAGSGNLEPKFMYYVNDGVYGSFNCLLFDHATVEPNLVDPEEYELEPRFASSVWGPTCDGLDCILQDTQLPELESGDWLVFRDMGAYTTCAASNFNGMPKPRCYHLMQDQQWHQVVVGGNKQDEFHKIPKSQLPNCHKMVAHETIKHEHVAAIEA